MYRRKNKTPPTLEDIFVSLRSTVASFSQTYILVDALDELQQSGNILHILLSKFRALQSTEAVNMMTTSRKIPHIVAEFEQAVRMEVRASDEDVLR